MKIEKRESKQKLEDSKSSFFNRFHRDSGIPGSAYKSKRRKQK